MLRQLILAGATTFRLNFSHGDHDYHQHTIRLIRQTAFELNEPVGILQDLQGPKIRLGKFTCGSINLKMVILLFLLVVKLNVLQKLATLAINI